MQYLLLIYWSEAAAGKMDAAARQEMSAEYGKFTQSIIQSGNFKAGDGLQSVTTATTVRVRDGKTVRSRKRVSSLAAIIWSRPRISMPPSPLPRGFPAPNSAQSRCGRSRSIIDGA
jgi:hypothetical protein